MNKRYQASLDQLKRAETAIPLGSQTFSKSRTQLPVGSAPLFASRAKGSRFWDIDGNEYIDFVNSLASVTLGYGDPDVNSAVARQLEEAVILSLPHVLETEVAERIVEMVPCAEQVRFGKNGSDATAGAIRLARAITGRDHVAVCGYHGWQDWYIGATARNKGVPRATSDLTHVFAYNDIESLSTILKARPGEFAAVMLEPMNVSEPRPGFLESVKDLAHQHGALLVFDETITGFRFHNGGAQALFGVTPDLATFGKGLANGFPLSAVAGREELMKEMKEIFFSFTFGGELLSLAAAKATLDKLKREPVTARLAEQGRKLLTGVADAIRSAEGSEIFGVCGHPSWTFLTIKDSEGASSWQTKTLVLQEMFKRGIFMIGTHNLSYAHSNDDIEVLCRAYREVMPIVVSAARKQKINELLECAPLEPLFKIR